MTELGPSENWEIDDEKLVAHAPRVRALSVHRLESLYEVAQAQIAACGESGRPVDPRWADFALRVVRTQNEMYRLNKPAVEEEPDLGPAVHDPVLHVLETLAAVKERAESTDKPA